MCNDQKKESFNENTIQYINITKEYPVDIELVDKKAFAKFVREKRKEYNEDNGENISTEKLGEMIGIQYEMFRKILNQEKPTKKRDCIIAIGVALKLLSGEIDEALRLYQYMPKLDEQNPRDLFIMSQINGDNGITVKELNERLKQRGFRELDVQDSRDGKKKKQESPSENLPFKVMEMKVRTPISAMYYYGRGNSLCTTYDPSCCEVTGDMILRDLRKKKYVHLVSDTNGQRYANIIKDELQSIKETGDYENYFIELENTISIEKKRLLSILNDTRNYQKRTSARLFGDAICVFTEQFNYVIPELNEYYVLAYSAGNYKLYVYDQSAFMSWYLTNDTYSSFFETEIPEPKETYDSIETIDALMDSENEDYDKYVTYRLRKNAFKKLMPDVDDLFQKIKEGARFIRNLNDFFDDRIDVLRYYGLEKDFECKYEEEYGNVCDMQKSKNYTLPDGTEITISLEDIYKAFQLGFSSIEEICRIKSTYGSVEAVLN